MRQIKKDFKQIPEKLLDCSNKNEAELLEQKIVKASCYKKANPKLNELYLDKCAYCELKYLATSWTDIEHYRPKSKYYWLAYEWSNLLPTCPKCNRLKNDEFPLINEDKRVSSHSEINGKLDKSKCKINSAELLAEQPYILNPEIDNPTDFFDLKIEDNKRGIEILGTDNKNRGGKTIVICDLNRIDLLKDRQERVIDNILELIDFSFYENNEALQLLNFVFKSLETKAQNKKLEHTLFRKILLNITKFEEIICPYIKDKNQRKIVLKAYKKYKNNYST